MNTKINISYLFRVFTSLATQIRMGVLVLVVFSLLGCGATQDKDYSSIENIITESEKCVNYNGKCYFSDGTDILVFTDGIVSTVLEGGKYIFFINDDYIYYSDKMDNSFDKNLYRAKLDGSDKELLLEHIFEAQYFKDRIYYSSVKDVSKYGADYNWNCLSSIDMNGDNYKEHASLKSILYFYVYDNGENDYIYVEIGEHISKYTLDGEYVEWISFDNIFETNGLDDKIYVASEKWIHEIDLNSFTETPFWDMTADTMKVYDKTLYAELYKDNADRNNRKWYELNEEGVFVEIQ